jgi:hypothetical protein
VILHALLFLCWTKAQFVSATGSEKKVRFLARTKTAVYLSATAEPVNQPTVSNKLDSWPGVLVSVENVLVRLWN